MPASRNRLAWLIAVATGLGFGLFVPAAAQTAAPAAAAAPRPAPGQGQGQRQRALSEGPGYLGPSFLRIEGIQGDWRGAHYRNWVRIDGHYWQPQQAQGQ